MSAVQPSPDAWACLEAAPAHPALVIIDGRSGAGKTEFAARLAHELDARVIHMDDLYAGWHGLRTGSRLLERAILLPLSEGRGAVWRRWNWQIGDWDEEQRARAGERLIVEGCGSLTLETRRHASLALWLEAPEAVRLDRIRRRDGSDEWWELWRGQEDAHIAANNPARVADSVIENAGESGSPRVVGLPRRCSNSPRPH